MARAHHGHGLATPRRWRFIRSETGRILDVRLATDPHFDTEWLRDPAVIALFAAQDRAWDRAHGLLDGDDQEQAGKPAEVKANAR